MVKRVIGLIGLVIVFGAPTDAGASSLFDPRGPAGFASLDLGADVPSGVSWRAASESEAAAPRGGNRRVKAMLLSLLLPGLGEFYAGDRGWAYLFLGVEAGIWATYSALHIQGSIREDRYEEYAHLWGGVENPTGWDDTYYTNLGRYNTYGDYRVVAIRSGEGDLYPAEAQWDWGDDRYRLRYGDLRADADRSFHRAQFVAASALLNRALSVVHVARSVKNERPSSLSLRFLPTEDGLTPVVAWQTAF